MPAKRRRNQTGRRILLGIEDVDRMLKSMWKPGTANLIAKSALGKGITVMAREMRKRAPKGGRGNFKRAIGRRNAIPKGKSKHVAKVGLNVNVGKGRWMPHAHLVVLGTGDRMRGNKLARNERAVPGNKVGGNRTPRGKRGIGGRFSYMETLRPDLQWKRRTGRIKPKVSFIRIAIQSGRNNMMTAIRAGADAAWAREGRKYRKKVMARQGI